MSPQSGEVNKAVTAGRREVAAMMPVRMLKPAKYFPKRILKLLAGDFSSPLDSASTFNRMRMRGAIMITSKTMFDKAGCTIKALTPIQSEGWYCATLIARKLS
jgi:hypothetical protein